MGRRLFDGAADEIGYLPNEDPGTRGEGAVRVTGGGSVTVSASPGLEGSVRVTGGGTVTVTGQLHAQGSVTVTGGGSVTVTGASGEAHAGDVRVTGGGAVTVDGTAEVPERHSGAVRVTGGGAVTVAGFSGAEPELTPEPPDPVVPPDFGGVAIPAELEARWASGQHIGDAKPHGRVRVRTGRFNRRYAAWAQDKYPVGGVLHNPTNPASNTSPWQAFWEANSEWVELPNVRSIETGSGFAQNGIPTAVIRIDNVVAVAQPEGYHTFHRGYMAPLRGWVASGRTALIDEHGDTVEENEWFEKLARNAQIEITEGYGTDQQARTFVGFIDEADTTSSPDVITITARMGKQLTNERVFGWNMDPDLRGPIVFIDQDEADDITNVQSGVTASSQYDSEHGPEQAVDGDSQTAWWSDEKASSDRKEHIQITLPEGRYEDYGLNTYFDGMEAWISIYARELEDGSPPLWFDPDTSSWEPLPADEWVDRGLGSVGSDGNPVRPFVKHITGITADTLFTRELDGQYRLGDGSILRLTFSNLGGDPVWRAGVRTFYARRREMLDEAKTEKWIRVEDISDIVKWVLRWAGFKEWEVESTGVSLPKRLVVSRDMTYVDVINKVKEAIGFTFFVKPPTSWEHSLGVPVFRYNNVVASERKRDSGTPEDELTYSIAITDEMLLSAIDVRFIEEPLAYIIRVRGRASKGGALLSGDPGDTGRRVMAVFRPPWALRDSSEEVDRLGGFNKHTVRPMHLLKTVDECRFAAYFIALQQALESVKATVEFPGNPALDLDSHIELRDLGSGVTTRLWIAEWRRTLELGEKARYRQSVGGTLIDAPDVADMVEIINTEYSP